MKLGVNVHSDHGGLPYLRWLMGQSAIRAVRMDFPCRDTWGELRMLDQLRAALAFLGPSPVESLLIHAGYLGVDQDGFDYARYLNYLADEIVGNGLAQRTTIELWNNVNLRRYWPGTPADFLALLAAIAPAVSRIRALGIKVAGFSITLDGVDGWDWIDALRPALPLLDAVTVQTYPARAGEFTARIERAMATLPGVPIIVAETGWQGSDARQLCGYRQLLAEAAALGVEGETYLYHLFDDPSVRAGYGLMRIVADVPTLRPAARYIMREYADAELVGDAPADLGCCARDTLWRRVWCWIKSALR